MPTALLFLLLVVAHIIWGGGFIVIKLLIGSFTLPQILLARVFLAAVIYAVIWHKIPKPAYQKGDWKFLLLLALCEPFLLFSFETSGLAYTSASQAGMIVACAPLAAALGALFFYKEKVSTRCAMGICAAVAGVVVVSAFGKADAAASRPLLGNLFIFCGVLSSTAYALTVKHLAERYSFLFLSAIQVFGATLLFLPGALAGPVPAEISWKAIASMVYLGVGITFFVYVVINYALTRIKAAHVILFANLIPVSTLVLAYLILGERLLPMQYLGAALVVGGVLLAGAPESTEAGDEPGMIRADA
ncbi:DMT family transporter [Desulfoluna spongiiphila]|uniref:Permease of the drug/metabolite transporter (DMT) superfamily n=1 Tax=Desulfoluna spongiiphila TaxID=419481 RepID=A0A1G5CUM7_9BACT|nr:DMT family transporter [Desulfoluna spongiiphila]SCY06112.1 Permease of the drug/metabolite transporter (DMT) superfamily [Desulfoluna spongiiphila]